MSMPNPMLQAVSGWALTGDVSRSCRQIHGELHRNKGIVVVLNRIHAHFTYMAVSRKGFKRPFKLKLKLRIDINNPNIFSKLDSTRY